VRVAEAWLLTDGVRWVFLALALGALAQWLIGKKAEAKNYVGWPTALFASGLLLWLTQALWAVEPSIVPPSENAGGSEAAEISPLVVMGSMVFQLILVFLVLAWMVWQPYDRPSAPEGASSSWLMRLDQELGWRQVSWPKALLLTFLYGLPSAYLVGQCFFFTGEHWWKPLGFALEPQPLVQAFSESREKMLLISITIAATLLAPVCEEFLFRGFLYPAFKKVSGPVISALATSLAFGLIHGQATTTLPLALLGLCLVISYELTRSLKVPILIHMAFNGLNLLNLYTGGGRAE
jgi:membrane protease YdiL (CAAX protease family)